MADLNIPDAPAIEGATHLHSGKVRDLYRIDAGEHAGRLLMVASDRISAFDFVLDTTIPDKGEILTRMSLWWFDQLADLVPNHVVSTDVPDAGARAARWSASALDDVPGRVRRPRLPHRLRAARLRRHRRGLRHRRCPPGLRRRQSRLPEPIFTPATKADARRPRRERLLRRGRRAPSAPSAAAELRDLTLAVYAPGRGDRPRARHHPGRHQARVRRAAADGTIVLADEVLTPDSSRFWPADEWQPGRAQPSYDKQIVRNWLLSPESGWDRASGEAAARRCPAEVVERTRARYVEAYELLTGAGF